MCRPIRCKSCGKSTWAGCGAHLAQVRAAIPPDQWCPGHESPRGGWLSRALGR